MQKVDGSIPRRFLGELKVLIGLPWVSGEKRSMGSIPTRLLRKLKVSIRLPWVSGAKVDGSIPRRLGKTSFHVGNPLLKLDKDKNDRC